MKRNLLIILAMAFGLVVASICPMVSAGPTLPFEKIKSIAMKKGKLLKKGRTMLHTLI